MYKRLVMIGEKILVNRQVENRKGSIILPDSVKTGNKEVIRGVVLSKGKGSPLNSLKDINEGDVIAYPPSASIPISEELLRELNIESKNVEILEYRDVIGTI